MFDEDVEVNSKGVNAKIDYILLPRKEMEKIGFRYIRDHGEIESFYNNLDVNSRYYFCKTLDKGKLGSITFNVTLPVPYNRDLLDICILDEAFGQHYDYQSILHKNLDFEYAKKIMNLVEEQMAYLQNQGILIGHIKGEYI